MQPISLSLPVVVRLLLGLTTQHVTLGIVLCGRGNLAALNPVVGMLCASQKCPRVP